MAKTKTPIPEKRKRGRPKKTVVAVKPAVGYLKQVDVVKIDPIAVASAEAARIIEAVNQWAEDLDVAVLLLGSEPKEFAAAIIGTVTTPRPAVAYLRSKVIDCLIASSPDWTYEDAVEWYEYNIVRGCEYMSKESNPPLLIDDVEAF